MTGTPRERAFVRAHTRLTRVPYVPELRLHLAAGTGSGTGGATGDEVYGLWEQAGRLPFWAFAWAGGLALARHVLDHPALVRDRTVLDLASGSGLVAIAAALAGAAAVTAAEVDPLAAAAIALNAAANRAAVGVTLQDLLDGDGGDAEVVLAGDVFYEEPMARRVLPFLRRARARGARVLVGDPGRAYLPRECFTPVACQTVPTSRCLEDAEVKQVTIWRV
ncbi:class I SAM-dependent methyltransferase [Actinomadura scrupuli]|uniref:class I SAM-dependent methyltransferase n=1 Tax=Actinomadura scrupuli TaxID=559629 RepID=UPI003D96C6D5